MFFYLGHLDRLVVIKTEGNHSEVKERLQRGEHSEKVLFEPDCIFCGEAGPIKVKKNGVRVKEYTSDFSFGGGDKVLEAAERRNDEKLLIRLRGFTLFSREAKYHRRCYSNYCSKLYYQSDDVEAINAQNDMEQARQIAYKTVKKYITEHILDGMNVCKLSQLNDLFIEELNKTGDPNPNHRTFKLKDKISNDSSLKDKISLVTVKPDRCEFILVFSNKISIGEAIGKAYALAHQDVVKNSALYLHDTIKTAFSQSDPMPWPPRADDLGVENINLPPELFKFLSILIQGRKSKVTQKTERLILSIRQDLLVAATNGKWAQPKHILMGTTLRHLFRSKEVCKTLNSCFNKSKG